MKVGTEFGVQMLCIVPEKVQCQQQQNLVQHIHSDSGSDRPSPGPVLSFFLQYTTSFASGGTAWAAQEISQTGKE